MSEFKQGIGGTITITGAPTGFTAEILNAVKAPDTVPKMDMTSWGTTGHKDYRPGKLRDRGDWTLTLAANMAIDQSTLAGLQGAASFVFGDAAGTTYTIAAGFISECNGFDIPAEERPTMSAVYVPTGAITVS